jgi:hypothetical protein
VKKWSNVDSRQVRIPVIHVRTLNRQAATVHGLILFKQNGKWEWFGDLILTCNSELHIFSAEKGIFVKSHQLNTKGIPISVFEQIYADSIYQT